MEDFHALKVGVCVCGGGRVGKDISKPVPFHLHARAFAPASCTCDSPSHLGTRRGLRVRMCLWPAARNKWPPVFLSSHPADGFPQAGCVTHTVCLPTLRLPPLPLPPSPFFCARERISAIRGACLVCFGLLGGAARCRVCPDTPHSLWRGWGVDFGGARPLVCRACVISGSPAGRFCWPVFSYARFTPSSCGACGVVGLR
jgi:hypothetical protein